MTLYGSVMTYKRTPEHQAKLNAALRGRKQSADVVAKRVERRKENGTYKHKTDHYKSRTYNTWDNMIQRCENENRREYKWYGARGIKVCPQWHDFATFFADMGERPKGLTLDRVNNDGNYEPGNCRWATSEEQAANRRRSSYYDRGARVNECGHLDRTHKARGMCASCYFTWRTKGKP